ncbi:armadillo-type protein [Lipomyces oligophaga]|uniref:armadillo-type protein n=1 Tax=Lipomyces oligophaga TaxID=45792 RepID=UPI0034CEE604
MPKEQKKRGRRHKKAPYHYEESEKYASRNQEPEVYDQIENLDEQAQDENEHEPTQEHPQAFYGMLDETQLEYFKQAVTVLDADAFSTSEEKQMFLSALKAECLGIELKVMTDPTGSKAFEQLLLFSSSEQLLELSSTMASRIAELCTQRFSSHCLETLLNCSRRYIADEVAGDSFTLSEPASAKNNPFASLVVDFYQNIKPEMYRIASHPFGSHVFRTLLLVLSGMPLIQSSGTSSGKSLSTKKRLARSDAYSSILTNAYQPPAAFKQIIDEVLTSMESGLSTEEARALATEPISSPVVQLILDIEASQKQYFMLDLILPPRKGEMDFITTSYLESLLSNQVGSHFLEKFLLVCTQSRIDYLYSKFFEPRLKILKNAHGFSFAVKALMQKASKLQVSKYCRLLLDQVGDLTLPNVILLNAITIAISRFALLEEDILTKIKTVSEENRNILLALLGISDPESITESQRSKLHDSLKQRCLLIESLLSSSSRIASEITSGFIALPEQSKIKFLENPVLSHVAESILRQKGMEVVVRRKLLNDIVGHMSELACTPGGSRAVDACNSISAGLNHYRERIAKELLADRETLIRNPYGKKVWFNWHMDIFARTPAKWKIMTPGE